MTIDHAELQHERTDEHVRFTWACVAASDCTEVEHDWTATADEAVAHATAHVLRTEHEVVVIRESRQVTTIWKGDD